MRNRVIRSVTAVAASLVFSSVMYAQGNGRRADKAPPRRLFALRNTAEATRLNHPIPFGPRGYTPWLA